METMFKIKFDKELTFYEIENFIATILLFSNKIDSGVSFVRMCDNSDQQINCNLPPVYHYDIRCDKCGRFINSKEFKKNGGASECFVPDSDVSTEEINYRCKKCTKEHGMVKAFQSVRHDLTSWVH